MGKVSTAHAKTGMNGDPCVGSLGGRANSNMGRTDCLVNVVIITIRLRDGTFLRHVMISVAAKPRYMRYVYTL